MRKGLLAVLFFIMLMYAAYFQPKMEDVKAVSNNELVIMAYGDSISYGETLSDLTKAYPAVFAQKYVENFNARFYARGVSGDTTSDLLEDLQPYVDGTAFDMETFEDADVITLCIGANNVLGPALNNISGFLTGSVSEDQYQSILDAGVEQFKQDYPQILSAFEGKKVIVMTVYNPYKYLSLSDVSISSSISSYESMIRNALSSYDVQFQTMLNMSMESLQIINSEIRNSSSDEVFVVDIWEMFEGFSKDQYLEYINSDISKLTITMADIGAIMQNNLSSFMGRVTSTCDPHPTEAGHAVIAQKSQENFNLFSLSANKNLSGLNKSDIITFSVNPIVQGNYTYKCYKEIGASKELIFETNNNSFEIQASEIEGFGKIFVEVCNESQQTEKTNQLTFNLEFAEDPIVPEEPVVPENPEDPVIPENPTEQGAKTSHKKIDFRIYVFSLMFGLPILTIIIYSIIKAKNKTKVL